MKKIKLIILAVCMLMFVGCGKETEDGVISTDQLLSVYNFDIEDHVKLGDYESIQVEIDNHDVTDDDVKAYMKSCLKDSMEYKTIEKESVEDGDVVNIDYVGKIDGKEFDGGTDKGTHLKIGSNEFIDGFEKALIGHKAGDEMDINLTFPDDYWNEDYKGKAVSFSIKINAIEESKAITYDSVSDEYVKENYGYETKEEWRTSIRSTLENSAKQQVTSEVQEQVLQKLSDICKVNIPDDLLEEEVENTAKQAEAYAKDEMDGMSMEDYLKQYEGVETVEEYKEKMRDEVKHSLTERLMLDAVIKKKGATITEDGFNDFIFYYIDAYGTTEEKFFARYGSREHMMLVYAENLMLSELVDKAQSEALPKEAETEILETDTNQTEE